MTIKVKIECDKCGNKYTQEINYISEINWICPKCNSSTNTFMYSYDDDSPDDEPLVMGKGGCGKQKTW